MCIMEVRPEQHHATIAQAMAHNTSTIDRDLEMFVEVLRARVKSGHHPDAAEVLDSVLSAQGQIHRAYAQLLTVFGEFVAHGVMTTEGHVHSHDHGDERSLVAVAHHDAGLARQYETR